MEKVVLTLWEIDNSVCPLSLARRPRMTVEMTSNAVQVILTLLLLSVDFCVHCE
jgi:hypothetical protein